MTHLDKKLPSDIEKLKAIAAEADHPQMKRAIENRLKTVERDQTVHK
jgi:hypothetical protein